MYYSFELFPDRPSGFYFFLSSLDTFERTPKLLFFLSMQRQDQIWNVFIYLAFLHAFIVQNFVSLAI